MSYELRGESPGEARERLTGLLIEACEGDWRTRNLVLAALANSLSVDDLADVVGQFVPDEEEE
jgi:hypothetical protein